MIAFGPDTDVPVTPVQRFARWTMVGTCSVLAVGVMSSVVRLWNSTPAATAMVQTHRPRSAAEPAAFAVMATGVPIPARPAVELVHDAGPATPVARPGRVEWMLVTAYCPCVKCCGKNAAGLTASGRPTSYNYGHFVAAPAELPFGSHVVVPGYNRGRAVPVLDRGGAIKAARLDVFFPTHEAARAWGRRWVAVTITGG